ncbi:hypothetical protein Adt_35100 [Abeliophyllum distichum]|uniref:Uncharacterized protein n=1 Tax=Abeliophyllum distichum TaxID=126358 RepID=A0ABD1QDR6_9LAMI
MYLWFRHSFGMEMPLHVFQTIYQPRKLSKKKGREEEAGWYYFCPWGSQIRLRVVKHPLPIIGHTLFIGPCVYGIANSLSRCELSGDIVDVLRSIYQADPKTQSYGLILNRHRCLVGLDLMTSKVEMEQGRRPRPTLARLTKQRPKVLVLGSAEDTSQRKVIEDLSMEGNKEAVEASKVIEVD